MADGREVPRSRLRRLAHMASVGVRTGAGMLLERDGSAAARHAVEVMGNLRGVATKLGQMMSYVDGFTPGTQSEQFQSAMRALRAAAPASPFAEVRALLEAELRHPLTEVFRTFEETPVASASIGQVHRAVLADGREVAVKVQHPGIAEGLEADLRNSGMLEGLVGAMGGRRIHSGGMFEELRTRLREELDYSLEARHQQRFREIHAGDPQVRIPEVITELSGPRVLVTAWAAGKSFEEACEGTPAQREAWAKTLWRFVFRGNLVAGVFNADPHPGNYFFHDDGSVTFLDFGCVQVIDPLKVTLSRRMHRSAGARDEADFRIAAAAYAGTRGGRYEEMATRFIRSCFDPLFGSPYRMTRPYAASLVASLASFARESLALPDHEVTPMPTGILFMNRMNFGFYSVLARLDCVVDYVEVERGFLPATDD